MSLSESIQVHTAAVLGCGLRADDLARQALESGRFRFTAVCDPNPGNREKLKTTCGGTVEEFDDYRTLLDRGEFDVLFVTTPDFAHEEHALAALEAGKHLLLEKPIAITYEGGRRIVDAVAEADRACVVGFVLRYAPLYARAKELVDDGWIGDLKAIWVLHSVQCGSMWYFHDWHGTFANTSGLLLQKGSHDFDIINWFAGSQAVQISALGSRDVFGGDKPNDLTCPTCPERLTCPERRPDDSTMVQCAFRREIDCLDNHLVLMQYANGVKATYNECHYTPDDNREYVFIGTKGKLKLDDHAGKLSMHLRHCDDRVEYHPGNIAGGHGGGDIRLFTDLAAAVETGAKPLAGVQEGLESIRCGLMAHESIRRGGGPITSI